MKFLEQEYTVLPVDMLVPHPDNPNLGNDEALADSIDTNGYYGAVTVRAHPDLPGKFQILAGEHRWKYATEHGDGQIPAIIVDAVDDVQAIRILFADNEVARRGSYDHEVLDATLEKLGSLKGTGFDDQLNALGAQLDDEKAEADAEAQEYRDSLGADSEFVTEYGVLVMAQDEASQKALYDTLAAKFGVEALRVVSV